jgi:hypothetical protein
MADDRVEVLSLGIDCPHQARHRHVSGSGDLLEAFPEGILNADAGLVPGDDERAFRHCRFLFPFARRGPYGLNNARVMGAVPQDGGVPRRFR